MKHDLNLVDPPLLKLGPKVVEWRPISKVEYDLIGRAFELAGFESINFGRLRGITEADCRQIKITSPQEAQSLWANQLLTLKVTRVQTISPGCAVTTWVKTRALRHG